MLSKNWKLPAGLNLQAFFGLHGSFRCEHLDAPVKLWLRCNEGAVRAGAHNLLVGPGSVRNWGNNSLENIAIVAYWTILAAYRLLLEALEFQASDQLIVAILQRSPTKLQASTGVSAEGAA